MIHSPAPLVPPHPPAAPGWIANPPPLPDLAERIIGSWGRAEGPTAPTLIVIAGLHGNEPAGVVAMRRVLSALERRGPESRGRIIGLAGNLPALAQGRRFIDRDLNRHWSEPELAAAREREAGGRAGTEDLEQLAVAASLDELLASAEGPVYMLDCHTTSSISAPFMLFADTLVNREFAQHFPLPLVLGLEETIVGALFDHYQGRGVVTLGVEGGQHASPEAINNLEAVIWLALAAAGCLA